MTDEERRTQLYGGQADLDNITSAWVRHNASRLIHGLGGSPAAETEGEYCRSSSRGCSRATGLLEWRGDSR
jgi:hypothetical protein